MSTASTSGIGQRVQPDQRLAMSSRVGFSRSGRNRPADTSFDMTIGVFTVVGFTVLTRIMYGASSWASTRMSPTTPCLAAE